MEKFSDETILAGLRELATLRAIEQGLLGEQGRPALARVPKTAWDAWRDSERLPSAVRILQRYGTWNHACLAAGIPVVQQRLTSGPAPRWTDQQIVGWVARFVADAEAGTSYAAYSLWCVAYPEAPGPQTVRNRLGGWNAARSAAAELAP